MPEDNPETGVKDGTEVSPASVTPVMTVEPPAVEHTVQTTPEKERYIPYSRFHEVNEKMRSYETELHKMRQEKELAEHKAVPSETDDKELTEEEIMSKYQSRLEEKGIDPKTSGVLAQVIKDIAKQEAKERYVKESGKAEARRQAQAAEEKSRMETSQKDIAKWQDEFRKAHEDYAEFEPLMQKEWEGLDQAAKLALVASPKAHELLYKVAKASQLEKARVEGEEAGRNSAYETKGLKTAISSLPGSSPKPGKKFTAEDVGDMSPEFYKANKAQILKDLGMQ